MISATDIIPTTPDALSNIPQTMLTGPRTASDAAYSMMTSNVGAIALVSAVTIGGAAYTTYRVIKHVGEKIDFYIEESFKHHIDDIQKLYRDKLEEIRVNGCQVFPPIFDIKNEKVEKGEKLKVDAIHFTESAIQTKGRRVPRGMARALNPYKNSVKMIINYLKDYREELTSHNGSSSDKDFIRQKNGVAICVVDYLLDRIESHVQKFEGYEGDIAILGGLLEFMIGYASMGEKKTQSRRYSFLQYVYKEAELAKAFLEVHKEVRSLYDILMADQDDCWDFAEELLQYFVMLSNDNKWHKKIANVAKKMLAAGKLQNFHILKTNPTGINIFDSVSKEVEILISPCRQATIDLATFAEEVIDGKITYNDDQMPNIITGILSMEDLKELEDFEKMEKNKIKLDEFQKTRKLSLEVQVKNVRAMFNECQNFVTKKAVEAKNKTIDFIPIIETEDRKLMIRRAQFPVHLCNVIVNICKRQYYCNKICEGIEALGEIYITSYQNREIFETFNTINTAIRDGIELIIGKENGDYVFIKKSNNGAMPIGDDHALSKLINDGLTNAKKVLENSNDQIQKFWESNKNKTKQLKEIAEKNVLMATTVIRKSIEPEIKTIDTIFQSEERTSRKTLVSSRRRRKEQSSSPKQDRREEVISERERSLSPLKLEEKQLPRSMSSDINRGDSNANLPTVDKRNIRVSRSRSNEEMQTADKASSWRTTAGVMRKLKKTNRLSDKRSVVSADDYTQADSIDTKSNADVISFANRKDIINNTTRENSESLISEKSTGKKHRRDSKPDPELINPAQSLQAIFPTSPAQAKLGKKINYLKRLKRIREYLDETQPLLNNLQTEKKEKELYLTLYSSLMTEYDHLQVMIEEQDISLERDQKINRLLSLIKDISSSTKSFFTSDCDPALIQFIRTQIATNENQTAIDLHKKKWKQGIFPTSTRSNVNNIDNVCDEILKLNPVRKKRNKKNISLI